MKTEKKSQRQEMREKMRHQAQQSRLIIIGLIIAGAALLVVAVAATQKQAVENIVPVAPLELSNRDGLTIGNPDAKVTIDVFEDFQCSACKYFSENTEPLIIQYLAEPGKARLTFHNYPFLDGPDINSGGASDQAANATMCANEQGKFWEMKASIYANLGGENQGSSNRRIEAMAESIGLDVASFNNCFTANKYEENIQADYEYGQELGVSGTPSVFVNGVKVGDEGKVPSYQQIAEAVELALAAAQ
jgi:protein-disulfide isomerase